MPPAATATTRLVSLGIHGRGESAPRYAVDHAGCLAIEPVPDPACTCRPVRGRTALPERRPTCRRVPVELDPGTRSRSSRSSDDPAGAALDVPMPPNIQSFAVCWAFQRLLFAPGNILRRSSARSPPLIPDYRSIDVRCRRRSGRTRGQPELTHCGRRPRRAREWPGQAGWGGAGKLLSVTPNCSSNPRNP